MDPADQTKLIGFLNQGKSLYIEGDFGYFVQNTEFYKMLGCTYLDGGDSTASVMSFSGQNSTIAEGAQLTYLPTNYYWYITRYIDELGSNGSKMIFKCNFNKNRAATYEGKNGTYRVIYSAFVFMGIRGKDVKDKLMKKYVDYLLGVSPIVKEYDKLKIISSTCFDLNPYIIKNRISFILNQPTKIQADIFSIKGQLMRNIINENLYQGNHVFTLNLNDDNLSGSGRYILRFKADEETVNKVFILAK